jgi:hypothetical protein
MSATAVFDGVNPLRSDKRCVKVVQSTNQKWEELQMLKRICFVSVALLTLINGIQLTAFAAGGNLSTMLLNAAPEKVAIQQTIQNSNVTKLLFQNKRNFNNPSLANVTAQSDLSYGTPYKVVAANAAVTGALLSGHNLVHSIMSASYYWEVPVLASGKAVTSFMIDKVHGKWKVVEIGACLSSENIAFSSDVNQLEANLKTNALDNASSVTHLRIASIHQDYLYVGGNQESFIPIRHGHSVAAKDRVPSVQEKSKLTRAEVLNQIGDVLRQNRPGQNANIPLGGIGVSKPQTGSPFNPLYLLTLVPVALLVWTALRNTSVD